MKKPPASLVTTQEAGVVASSHFSDTWSDFLQELLAYYGCQPDHDGVWYSMGSSNFGVSATPKPWHSQVKEHGWHRWALPGVDGVARSRFQDKSAPWCELSPTGVLFLHVGRSVNRVTWAELLDAAAEHALLSGAAMGWRGKA